AMGPTYAESPLFKDVAKYLYRYNYGFAAGPWIVNLDLWNSLSAEDQDILQTAMTKALSDAWDRGEELDRVGIDEMKAAGVEIVELTTEQMSANVEACRDKVWAWVETEMFSKEFMDMVRGLAQPLP
ncbi:unnamed protein product, partial [marine sediment metagenome]